MRNLRTALDYPVVIKQSQGYLVFSIPDLNIHLTESLDSIQDPESLGRRMVEIWKRVDLRLQELARLGKAIPPPADSTHPLARNKKKWVTPEEASRLLGMSVQTVRRMADEGFFTCRKTRGGHRKIRVDSLQGSAGTPSN